MGINQKILLFLLLFSFQVHAERIDINFKNLSLSDFIKMIGKITQKNILVDENIQGNVNLDILSIEKGELIPLTRFLLQRKGLMLVDKGYMYHVTKIDFSQKYFNKNNLIIEKNSSTEEIKAIYIAKVLLDYCKKNTRFLWKNIGISEYKINRKLKGFKVNYIKRNSIFDKLGFRRGDIILKLNGTKLTYDNEIFSFVKILKSDNIKKLTFEILRNNQTIELSYDIQ